MSRSHDDAESAPSPDSEPSVDLTGPRQETKVQRRGRPASRWMVPEGGPRLLARPLRRKTDDP